MDKRGIEKVTLGGWYQRTTLHLTEIFDFFSRGESRLNLDKEKLLELWKALSVVSVTREMKELERVYIKTREGIEICYYEDGLYTLEIKLGNIEEAVSLLKEFYEKKFAPAVNYIFSLGAPTPKILSNMKDHHPIIVRVISNNPRGYGIDEKKFGKVYSEISHKEITVKKTANFIFIIVSGLIKRDLDTLAEMQIFFREFKDQLKRYLEIHRVLWEKIDLIIEKESIKGKDVEKKLNQLEDYSKTINLINFRINKMDSYSETRASISKDLNIQEHLISLFQYRFEDLTNSLNYIKELWSATIEHVSSTIDVLKEIEDRTQSSNLESIKLITSVGVISIVLGYLATEDYPTITQAGIISFVILAVVALLGEFILRFWAKNKKYSLELGEVDTKI